MRTFWVDYDLRILRPFCFRSLFSRSFGLSACRVRTTPIPHRATAHAWHAATTCSGTNLKSSWGLNVLNALMKPSVSAGSPAKGCDSPSSSPAQLSCFQPFVIFFSHSLAKDELLMGMQHATCVHGTTSHSPDGALHQQIPMAVSHCSRPGNRGKAKGLGQSKRKSHIHTTLPPLSVSPTDMSRTGMNTFLIHCKISLLPDIEGFAFSPVLC